MTSRPSAPSKADSSAGTSSTKPQCRFHPSAIIADKAQLSGPGTITIDADVIIHPHAKLAATLGNVSIGSGSTVSEKAIIGLTSAPSSTSNVDAAAQTDVVIGDGVNVESGALVEARKIGDHSVIGINSKIGRGAVVGKWCKVAALCEVKVDEVLEDFTVVFGEGQAGRRLDVAARDKEEVRRARMKGMEMERELLKGVIVDGKVKWGG